MSKEDHEVQESTHTRSKVCVREEHTHKEAGGGRRGEMKSEVLKHRRNLHTQRLCFSVSLPVADHSHSIDHKVEKDDEAV